jgi:hypothetical protein
MLHRAVAVPWAPAPAVHQLLLLLLLLLKISSPGLAQVTSLKNAARPHTLDWVGRAHYHCCC